MAYKKLTSQQADTRQRLLYRLAQLTEAPGHIDPLSPAELDQVERMHAAPTKANRPIVVLRGKVKTVTPEEKKRFNAAVRDPKNKDRQDYPEIVIL